MKNLQDLKSLLLNLKPKVVDDRDAVELIDHALSNIDHNVNFDHVE